MDGLDLTLIKYLSSLASKYLPFTNIVIFGVPVGQYTLILLLFYIGANIIFKNEIKKNRKGAH